MSGPRPVPSPRPVAAARQVRRPAAPDPAVRPGRSGSSPAVQARDSTPPARPDPRRFVGRLKRLVVAGSVVGAGVFWALVAEHVVGITSVQGSSGAGTAHPGGGAVPQAASPYDGFFGPAAGQGATGAFNPGVQAAAPGLVNGGGGAPIMTTSGS